MSNVSDFTKRQSVKTLYGIAKDRAKNRFKGFIAYVSPTIYRALVADEILFLLAAQDESISAETVRELLNGLFEKLCDDPDLN